MVKIAPSILSADFGKLGLEVRHLTNAGADWIHVDVMDGHFVNNLTFGPVVVSGIRPYTNLPLDVHLMMTNPGRFIQPFAEAGADYITVHLEIEEDISTVISQIRKEGKKVGLSLRPSTKVSDLLPYLPDIDLVLMMSVEPGFGGQAFQPQAIEKIAALKEWIGQKPVLISVDGGINPVTAPACVLAGADVLVAGSFILKRKPYSLGIQALKECIRGVK